MLGFVSEITLDSTNALQLKDFCIVLRLGTLQCFEVSMCGVAKNHPDWKNDLSKFF